MSMSALLLTLPLLWAQSNPANPAQTAKEAVARLDGELRTLRPDFQTLWPRDGVAGSGAQGRISSNEMMLCKYLVSTCESTSEPDAASTLQKTGISRRD